MKVGSIVICIDDSDLNPLGFNVGADPVIKGNAYTVKAIRKETGGLQFFEVFGGTCIIDGREGFYKNFRFREIEFPPSLESEIKECLTREFEPCY